MKYGKSDVERQISIQHIHLSTYWNYFRNREGNFKVMLLYYDSKSPPFSGLMNTNGEVVHNET